MPNQNSFDANAQNNPDGGQVGMGLTFARLFKWLGADVTIQGNGAAVVTFPTGTATLLSSQLNEFGTLFTQNPTAGASDRLLQESSPSFGKNYINMSQIFSDPVLVSNTYTPTVTSGSNLKGATVGTFRYWRLGDLVVVLGVASLSATTSGTFANVFFSLPIPSALGVTQDLVGFMNQLAVPVANPGQVIANTGTGAAEYQWICANTTLQSYRVMWAYVVK